MMETTMMDQGWYDMRYLSGEEGEASFGIHFEYQDLYSGVVFLTSIYLAGQISSRVLRMPSLVGEIFAGILLGPGLAGYVPNEEAWVLLGEIGLILLVMEAGIDIDVSTLKLIGTRGLLVAVVGSILPIGFGMIIAYLLLGSGNVKAVIAAGASFGPTSLGIALNILKSGGVLNTPVGQLIISAAVIDDMIALIILSQLESLTGTITAAGILVPILSAFGFLAIGGYIALYVIPGVMEKFVLSRVESQFHGRVELIVMFAFLLALMPATFYSKASYLMGAFVAGLAFCTSHELHHTYVVQFKRLLQWLMRIFFAASIGFQVPITKFGDTKIILQGLAFALALLGKVIVGFMVPNFTHSGRFRGYHLRDCLITGFSLAAEGEFAFVIAVYGADNGLIDEDTYSSVVFAVLLSTIIPPFLLRFTINYYKRKSEEEIQQMADDEMKLNHNLEVETAAGTSDGDPTDLMGEIQNDRAVFLVIQTQSEARWGLLISIMSKLGKLGLDVIDHRSWHPRGIYAKDRLHIVKKGTAQEVLETRIEEITKSLDDTINQPDSSKVKVQRWYPGVVEEFIESVSSRAKPGKRKINLEERLLREAAMNLDKHQATQTLATKEKTVDEILSDMQSEQSSKLLPIEESGGESAQARPARRRRQKMRSTPVVGGGLFGENDAETLTDLKTPKKASKPATGGEKWKPDLSFGARGHRAEIIVDGESYMVRIDNETLKQLRTGFSGDMLRTLGDGGMSIMPDSSNVVSHLQGFVRSRTPLAKISEDDHNESDSDTSSIVNAAMKGPMDKV